MTPAKGPDLGSDRPLLEKLGVNQGMRVSVLGFGHDEAFLAELRGRGADVSTRKRKATDLLFYRAEDLGALDRLAALEPYLERNGAIWVVYPRGRKDIREVAVIQAGLDAGYVDNKIARFSDTHTAMRLVIPLARR
jgi:Protein of unknown function (DUF3052)